MLTEEDSQKIVEAIGESSKQIMNASMNFSNDITQKYANTIRTDMFNPLCDKLQKLTIDMLFIKGVLKKLGVINDVIYNKYIEDFKKLNSQYFTEN